MTRGAALQRYGCDTIHRCSLCGYQSIRTTHVSSEPFVSVADYRSCRGRTDALSGAHDTNRVEFDLGQDANYSLPENPRRHHWYCHLTINV
jgi:hypothetical protein